MWKDYLSFSRQEQKGFVFLMVLLLVLIFIRLGVMFYNPPKSVFVTKENSIFIEAFPTNSLIPQLNVNNITDFNPNEVSFTFLVDIGINKRIANNWVNYLSKGGVFFDVSDVAKVYGIDSTLFEVLQPHMYIPKNQNKDAKKNELFEPVFDNHQLIDLNKTSKEVLLKLGWSKSMIDTLLFWSQTNWFPQRVGIEKLREWNTDSLQMLRVNLFPKKIMSSTNKFVLDMNHADTTEWVLLKGIGSVLSKRIVAYRRKLGGFHSHEQLLEVYGISPILVDDVRPFLIVDTLAIKRHDINKATIRQLRDHPYIDFYNAQALVEERKKRGKYMSIHELLEAKVFNEAQWKKARHYLVVN